MHAAVLDGAAESKRRAKGDVVSVSRNVFIPLTNLCRDRCAYCTFAKQPDDPAAKTYTLDEVRAASWRGALRAGCTEALFCLGDKPEIAYRSHRAWLAARGLATTAEYLVQACELAFAAGILPHSNAGILRRERDGDAAPVQRVARADARERESAPAREAARRTTTPRQGARACACACTREAGELRIPFTSGILLGIGENDAERVDTLLAIRDLDDRYGHIQEVIVQHVPPEARHADARRRRRSTTR